MSSIKIGKLEISNNAPLVFIAGPCAIESKAHSLSMAHNLKKISTELGVGLIFKSSFDKANRTSIKSKRGVGLDASLDIFAAIKEETDLPILTDVHEPDQCGVVGEVVDIIQIPAFLCRQTDLIQAAAETKKIINVKKGQFLSYKDVDNIKVKVNECWNDMFMVTERGTMFGYGNTLEIKMILSDFYIGEIMLLIIGFYFGGRLAESIRRKPKE